MNLLYSLLYIILAPLIGGLLTGADRIISARMQGRYGPPLLQPFYDVIKLFNKERAVVNKAENFFIALFIVFTVFTGALFFSGGDMLLAIFALTLSEIFLVVGAYSTNSPYSTMGAERELLQMMAYEPMILIFAMGMYLSAHSFAVTDILASKIPAVVYLPGVFIGYVFILAIKFRKSPFDLSTSHHAHQEIVRGITTEFAGPTLALVEISHWYENVLLLGFLYLFFAWNSVLSVFVGIAACLLLYFIEILIDNTFARLKWQVLLSSTWICTATVAFINLVVLSVR